ncbi:unnamed protein product [Boreogadus saida]
MQKVDEKDERFNLRPLKKIESVEGRTILYEHSSPKDIERWSAEIDHRRRAGTAGDPRGREDKAFQLGTGSCTMADIKEVGEKVERYEEVRIRSLADEKKEIARDRERFPQSNRDPLDALSFKTALLLALVSAKPACE